MSTVQQIQQEMQRELAIDKRIDKILRFFLKKNHIFTQVSSRDQAHVLVIFKRDNLLNYTLTYNDQSNETLNQLFNFDNITIIFLKNKNSHDTKKNSLSNIKHFLPSVKRIYFEN